MKDIGYYLELVRTRLADDGQPKLQDMYGNKVVGEGRAFTDAQILSFLEGSLQRLNTLLPRGLSFEGTPLEVFELADLVVQGAVITALASKALLEKGREFAFMDGGVEYHPPNVSDTLMRQWEVETNDYRYKVDLVRNRL